MHEDTTSWVAAGDQAIFNISGMDISKIRLVFFSQKTRHYIHMCSTGSILCSIQHPMKVSTTFEARIILFNIEIPITLGYSVSCPAVIFDGVTFVCTIV